MAPREIGLARVLNLASLTLVGKSKIQGENLLVGAQPNEGILHCCPYPKPRVDQLRIVVGFSDKMSLAKLFLGLNGFSQIVTPKPLAMRSGRA
jgi:hypothetical protein